MGVAFNCCLMTTEGTIAFVRPSPEEFRRIVGEVESLSRAARVRSWAVNLCLGIEVEGRSFRVVDMLAYENKDWRVVLEERKN